jgi:CDP-diacylglycerol--serine O-phosphatidyltransferase
VRFVTNMQKIVSFIPNLFTLGNLFCGCLAILFASHFNFEYAALMVFLAAFLDFFDGFLARLLKVDGELGKQLDSLADMVSFGVVPGIIAFQLILLYGSLDPTTLTLQEAGSKSSVYQLLPYIGLLIPVFSCYRLAKFNLDTRQTHGFIGLPTPANALFFCSLGLIISQSIPLPLGHQSILPQLAYGSFAQDFSVFFANKYVLIVFVLLFSLLLVSSLPIFALKFKNFGWVDNKIRYIFLVLCLVLLILFQLIAIPFIVILYILTSIVNNIFKLTV